MMRLYKPRKKYWKGKNRGKKSYALSKLFYNMLFKKRDFSISLNDGENIFLSSQNCWKKMKNLLKTNFLTSIQNSIRYNFPALTFNNNIGNYVPHKNLFQNIRFVYPFLITWGGVSNIPLPGGDEKNPGGVFCIRSIVNMVVVLPGADKQTGEDVYL